MTINATAPDANRTAVKPAASASPVRNAIRQSIELKANATSANAVEAMILSTDLNYPSNKLKTENEKLKTAVSRLSVFGFQFSLFSFQFVGSHLPRLPEIYVRVSSAETK